MAHRSARKGRAPTEKVLRDLLRKGVEEAGTLRGLASRPWAPNRHQTISGWTKDKPLDQFMFVVGLAGEAKGFRESFLTMLDPEYSEQRLHELEAENERLQRDLEETTRVLEAARQSVLDLITRPDRGLPEATERGILVPDPRDPSGCTTAASPHVSTSDQRRLRKRIIKREASEGIVSHFFELLFLESGTWDHEEVLEPGDQEARVRDMLDHSTSDTLLDLPEAHPSPKNPIRRQRLKRKQKTRRKK